jgi:hypothetical protein
VPEGRGTWDDAHENLKRFDPVGGTTLRTALANRGLRIVAIEPNILIKQEIPEEELEHSASKQAGKIGNEAIIVGKLLRGWPSQEKLDWHLDANGLRKARSSVLSIPNSARKVRVALLDTGYDPRHITSPKFFIKGLSTRFLLDGTQDDSAHGASKKSHHGTATMAILAGNEISVDGSAASYLGGAPTTEVFEVAVANDVIVIAVASVAVGLSYAVDNGADVVSISMGGIPSNAWAEAVNRAYEHGTVIIAASGNCVVLPIFGIFRTPTRTVYPAAFSRVLSVPGITASNRSYRWLPMPGGLWPWNWKDILMRGNIGPRRDMEEAVAAFTPNVPWAIWEEPDGYDHRMIRRSGAGTSCATPQVAAAAALWLQAKRPEIEKHYGWRTWQKTESVFAALCNSANFSTDRLYANQHDDHPVGKQFGMGILRADEALHQEVLQNPHPRKEAKAGLRWLDILFPPLRSRKALATSSTERVREGMYQLEAAQLLATSPQLQRLLGEADFNENKGPPDAIKEQFKKALLKEPAASENLKAAIRTSFQRER